MSEQFDVFLCHNSQDKPEVIKIARQLKQQGLKPWLDVWELPPGQSWQELLEEQIEEIKSAAVFVGSSGFGPWHSVEMRAFIREFVKRKCPVIPVLLEDAPQEPELPILLQDLTWVDFRNAESNPMGRLIWGITKIKPANFNSSQSSTIKNETVFTPPSQPSSSPQIDTKQLQVFEFEVVKVEVQRSGLLGLGSQVKLNRTRSQARYFTEALGNGVYLEMIAIPGGSFMMGSPKEELGSNDYQRPQHKVNVPNFMMGRYPITQAQWREVAGWEQIEKELDPDPSCFKDDYEGIDRWTRPVERVSWDDAKEFCARLSNKTKRKYRLPTEAEWEYACRAGTTTPFHFGETISTELANYRGIDYNSDLDGEFYPGNYGRGSKGIYREQTTPVGYFKVANNFGLSDMHGNVWEWCEDNWHDNYQDAPTNGRAWFSEESTKSVMRGGSLGNLPFNCRSACRLSDRRGGRVSNVGFRVVCVAPRTT